MDLQNVKTFVSVAKLENFTKAADEMNYAQSTVTAQIKSLEKELGYPLFERIGRKNHLTEGGREFLAYATQILQIMNKAQTIGQDVSKMKGTLRIGVLESLLIPNLLPVLRVFQKEFSNLEISIKVGQAYELAALLRQNQLDIIYVSNVIEPASGIKICYQHREELVFAASVNHELVKEKDISLQKAFSYPFIVTEPSGCCYGRLKEITAKNNLNLYHHIIVDSATAIGHLLDDGKSVAFLPQYALEEKIQKGELKKLDVKIAPQYYYCQLVCTKDKWLSPFIERFIEHFKMRYPEIV